MRSSIFMIVMFAVAAGLMTGCAASKQPASTTQTASAAQPCAECLVCKKNADLACVDVKVDESTPRYDYDGKTYYFCSDDCKNAFAKSPAKYASH